MAEELGVSEEEVSRMEGRMAASDLSFDGFDDDEDGDSTFYAPVHYLEQEGANPEDAVAEEDWQLTATERLLDGAVEARRAQPRHHPEPLARGRQARRFTIWPTLRGFRRADPSDREERHEEAQVGGGGLSAVGMAGGAPFLSIAAGYGALGVGLGAFGAHALKAHVSPAALETWHTAVSYQLTHTLALLAVGLWVRLGPSAGSPAPAALTVAGWSFAAGVLLFSGSLYALALGGPRAFGPVTPLGGVAFIVGWLALLWAGLEAAR